MLMLRFTGYDPFGRRYEHDFDLRLLIGKDGRAIEDQLQSDAADDVIWDLDNVKLVDTAE